MEEPKEKAISLMKRYITLCNGWNGDYADTETIEYLKKSLYGTQWWYPRDCAINTCDEILKICNKADAEYWLGVKNEIKKL